MKLKLFRVILTDKTTIGKLFIDGVFFCYTLEDAVRPKGVKIKGQTAICSGLHSLTLGWSPRFKQLMPYIYNQIDFNTIDDGHGAVFKGVRIHWGNYAKDTEGCILVGSTKSKDFIGNSKVTYRKLMEKLEKIDIVELIIYNP
jgi:hypothetical protein